MSVIGIDSSVSGIAGDMLIASILDTTEEAGSILNILVNDIKKINQIFSVKLEKKSFNGIFGLHLIFEGSTTKMKFSEIKENYIQLCEQNSIDKKYRQIGLTALNVLIEAEKQIHQTENVHLHELGTIDTLFDVYGVVYLLKKLNITHFQIGPVATGYGGVKTQHGILPVPAPATQYILEKGAIPCVKGPKGEATTPTGIAIMYSLINHLEKSYEVIWHQSGNGFGTKEFPNRANFVRTRLGKITEERTTINILETNIDDLSSEFLGHTVDKLLEIGALDVNYYPITMKKNRPAYTLRVLVKKEQTEEIADMIQRLTGTLGIRILHVNRHIGERKLQTKTLFIAEWDEEIKIRVKVGKRSKFEFDDLVRIAEKKGLTPLEANDILFKYL